jgi:tetratricopeptide (TPR) repeat protein
MIRSLAVAAQELGELLRDLKHPECVAAFEECAGLAHHVGDQALEATATYHLGTAYLSIPAIRSLDWAEQASRRSLGLYPEQDRQRRGRCWSQLGWVALERFKEAQGGGESESLLLQYLNTARQHYQQALKLIPTNAVADQAVIHNQLGNIYKYADELEPAVLHYRASIRYKEAAGNHYGAATTRFNIALAYAEQDRFVEALEWAQAALRNFQEFGEGTTDMVERTQGLIAAIKQDQAEDQAQKRGGA